MFSDTKAAGRVREQARRQVQNLNGFNYGAAAELFPSRSKAAKSRAKYMRFDTAAEAVRFLVEELPPAALLGAYLVVDERRFGVEEIRYLYENAGYPLARSASVTC